MRRRNLGWTCILVGGLVAGCASDVSNDASSLAPAASGVGGSASTAGSSTGAGGGATGFTADPSGAAPGSPGSGSNGGGQVQPGTLTAGTWDDNRNFDRFLSYRADLASQHLPGLLPFSDQEFQGAHDAAALAPHQTLDVSLVIDTTGSMGDELRYLQTEFLALSQTILARYPDAAQRWSLVLYRDLADAYVTRPFDFSGDAVDFQAKLAVQSAEGGGDYPESPERGLADAAQLSWRGESGTAKLLFWVADAPHHVDAATAMADAIRGLQAKTVHVYPVAASGVDELTESSMRATAELTGGRYLFLTDDSGVGDTHKEPTIPCYFVTKLNSAILRMVDIEMTGTYREPSADEIIRTGGSPDNGICTMSDGRTVTIF